MTRIPAVPIQLLVQDIGIATLVFLQLFFLGYGINALTKSLRSLEYFKLSALQWLSVSLVCCLATLGLMGQMGIQSVWIFCVLFGGLQLFGLVATLRNQQYLRQLLHTDRSYWATLVIIITVSVLYWTHNLRDLVALPTHHDGMAHTAFFLRIISSGNPLLHLNENAFAEYFGHSFLDYYPSGSHTLVATIDGWLVRSSIFHASTVLKGWLLLICAAPAPFSFWVSRRLAPERPLLVHVAVALLALTCFRFPVWGVDSGGFSRVTGQVVVLPLLLAIIEGKIPGTKVGFRRWFLALVFLGAFLLHPTIFCLVSFSLGFAFVIHLWDRRHQRHEFLRETLDLGASTGVGLGVLAIIVFGGNTLVTIDQGDLGRRNVPSTWHHFGERIAEFSTTVVDDFSRSSSQLHLGLWIACIGIAACFVPALARHKSKLIRLYPFWMFVVGLLLMTCIYSSFRPWFLVGELFYNKPSRLAETFFLCFILLWSHGFSILSVGIGSLKLRSRHLALGLLAFLVVTLILDVREMARNNTRHLFRYFSYYFSPLRSEKEELAEFIEAHTPPDSLFIYKQFTGDFIEARTGRRGFFMYLECPIFEYKTRNCDLRLSFYRDLNTELKHVIENANPSAPCFSRLSIFSTPVYILHTIRDFPPNFASQLPTPLCKNLMAVTVKNDFVVLAYEPQN